MSQDAQKSPPAASQPRKPRALLGPSQRQKAFMLWQGWGCPARSWPRGFNSHHGNSDLHQVHLTSICDMNAWGKRERMSEQKQRGGAFISTEKQQCPSTRNTQVCRAGAGRSCWMQLPGDISQKPKITEKNITFILQEKKWVGRADRAPAPRFWPHSSQPFLCLPGCPAPLLSQ